MWQQSHKLLKVSNSVDHTTSLKHRCVQLCMKHIVLHKAGTNVTSTHTEVLEIAGEVWLPTVYYEGILWSSCSSLKNKETSGESN